MRSRPGRKTVMVLLLGSIFLYGGFCIVPHSRQYRPFVWEGPLLEKANKSIFPSDVRSNLKEHMGQFTHWIGIIDTFMLESVRDSTVLTIVLDQKYYDYIEDFSIQQERMFVSPKGEGRFYYTKNLTNIHFDSAKSALRVFAARQNLGFCYGVIAGLKDGDPVLKGGRIRFVQEALYATNIFSYVVERDSLGRVVVNESGFPSLTNFEVLKIF